MHLCIPQRTKFVHCQLKKPSDRTAFLIIYSIGIAIATKPNSIMIAITRQMICFVFIYFSLLAAQLFCYGNNVLAGQAELLQQVNCRTGVTELVVDTDSAYQRGALFSQQ